MARLLWEDMTGEIPQGIARGSSAAAHGKRVISPTSRLTVYRFGNRLKHLERSSSNWEL